MVVLDTMLLDWFVWVASPADHRLLWALIHQQTMMGVWALGSLLAGQAGACCAGASWSRRLCRMSPFFCFTHAARSVPGADWRRRMQGCLD